MAFNKNKALESALKFLNQGKVAQAIGEYQQILRHDAKDQATLMTVGDLFARQGDMPQAIEYFERLAQVYLNDGFNSKAIAIYKKIAKLAPAELAPLERLADLYVQQGVLSEARPLFLQIAEVASESEPRAEGRRSAAPPAGSGAGKSTRADAAGGTLQRDGPEEGGGPDVSELRAAVV